MSRDREPIERGRLGLALALKIFLLWSQLISIDQTNQMMMTKEEGDGILLGDYARNFKSIDWWEEEEINRKKYFQGISMIFSSDWRIHLLFTNDSAKYFYRDFFPVKETLQETVIHNFFLLKLLQELRTNSLIEFVDNSLHFWPSGKLDAQYESEHVVHVPQLYRWPPP